MRRKPATSSSSFTARRKKSRGQHSQGLPWVLQMSPKKKCSTAEPSPKSTWTSTDGSGTIMKSPAVPKGVSQIGPNGDIIRLLPVQPTPFLSRVGSSRAGKPFPRTSPEMSQVATNTSSSLIMPLLSRTASPCTKYSLCAIRGKGGSERDGGNAAPEAENANPHIDSSPPPVDVG